jgi:hypothetical protein
VWNKHFTVHATRASPGTSSPPSLQRWILRDTALSDDWTTLGPWNYLGAVQEADTTFLEV